MTEKPKLDDVLLPDYSKALLDQLSVEYRIIQDKIDKIAGFRFTIRGWSVTILVAFGFGADTMKLPPYWILAAFLPLVSFLLMERSQLRNHDILCGRAVRIEKRIWRILRASSPAHAAVMIGGTVPKLAHELAEEYRSASRSRRWLKSIGYVIFYVAQMLLVVGAAVAVVQSQDRERAKGQQHHRVIQIDLPPERDRETGGTANGKAQVDARKP